MKNFKKSVDVNHEHVNEPLPFCAQDEPKHMVTMHVACM
jgi:hypothetical protein